ncbi:MAG: MSCRAMM family protein [Blastocatellia bacterium]
MSKLSFALSILVLPLALVSIQAQVAETKTGTATVSGRVMLKGEPARGVMVILQAQNPGTAKSPRVRADENGRFRFTEVAPGRYSISVLAPGYISPGDINKIIRAQTLNVSEGEKVENIDLEIKRGSVIAGRVIDSQGRAMIEEIIHLSKLDRNNRPQNYYNYGTNIHLYQTDDRGFYRIYGLPEGRYLVSVGQAQTLGSAIITSRHEFYPRTFHPDVTSESQARVIEVSDGSEATDIDITVSDPKQTHDVYGRVVDAGTGQPVAGVELMVGGLTRDGNPSGGYSGPGVRSGQNGEFRVFGVLPGKYAILGSSEEASGFVSDPVIIDISEGDARGVELRVRQGSSIGGVVVIEGTNDPKVLARLSLVDLLAEVRSTSPNPPGPAGRRQVKVNADGSFRIGGLQAGKATITVMALPRGLTIGRIEHNGAPAPEGIEIDPGGHVTGVRVVLLYGTYTLRGEVKIVGGTLPARLMLRVGAHRVDQPIQSWPGADVDARGQFVFENLTQGEYEIRVFPDYSSFSERLDPQIMKLLSSAKEKAYVGSNQQPVTIVIDLSRKEGKQ